MSAVFTLNTLSVCWSSSGIDISYRPDLLARIVPLLRKSNGIINQEEHGAGKKAAERP